MTDDPRDKLLKIAQERGLKEISDAEGEDASYVVCAPKDHPDYAITMDDSRVETVCCVCDRAVVHNRNVPKGPLPLCVFCAVKLAENNKVQPAMLHSTAEEIRNIARRKKMN